jgi:hypothetical protein
MMLFLFAAASSSFFFVSAAETGAFSLEGAAFLASFTRWVV